MSAERCGKCGHDFDYHNGVPTRPCFFKDCECDNFVPVKPEERCGKCGEVERYILHAPLVNGACVRSFCDCRGDFGKHHAFAFVKPEAQATSGTECTCVWFSINPACPKHGVDAAPPPEEDPAPPAPRKRLALIPQIGSDDKPTGVLAVLAPGLCDPATIVCVTVDEVRRLDAPAPRKRQHRVSEEEARRYFDRQAADEMEDEVFDHDAPDSRVVGVEPASEAGLAAPKPVGREGSERRWTLHRDSKHFFGSYQLMQCDNHPCDRDEHIEVVPAAALDSALRERDELQEQLDRIEKEGCCGQHTHRR